MNEQAMTYDEQKKAEWHRLTRIGWMYMTVEDFKGTLQALTELLVRDAQWAEKWKAAVDSRDTAYAEGVKDERERAEEARNL